MDVSRVHCCQEKLQETTTEVCVRRYAHMSQQNISFCGKKEKRLHTLEDTFPAKHQHIKENKKRNRWSSSVQYREHSVSIQLLKKQNKKTIPIMTASTFYSYRYRNSSIQNRGYCYLATTYKSRSSIFLQILVM